MRLLAAGLVLAAAAVAAGCGAGESQAPSPPAAQVAPSTAAPAPADTPTVVPPDPAAAAAIPIEGARPSEGEAIRGVLALLGTDGPVASVEVQDDSVTGRTLRLVVRRDRDVDVDLAFRAGEEIARQTARDPTPIAAVAARAEGDDTWVRDLGGPGSAPARSPDEVAALAHAVEARAERAGLALSRLEGYAIGAGIVVATIRFTEPQFAHGPTNWNTLLAPEAYGPGRAYVALVDVEAPDGTRLTGWPPPQPRTAPAAAGPTRLTLDVNVLNQWAGLERLQRVVLDCDGGASAGVVDPAVVCERLVAGRYLLLPPVTSDWTCSGVPDDWSRVIGTLAGEPIERGYGVCDGRTHALEELLGVRRLAPAAPDACLDAWNADADVRREAMAKGWTEVRITVAMAYPGGGAGVPACSLAFGSPAKPARFEVDLEGGGTGTVRRGWRGSGFTPSRPPPRSATVGADGRLVPIAPSERTIDDCVGAWNLSGVGAVTDLGLPENAGPAPTIVALASTAAACTVDVGERRLTGRWDADGLHWGDPERVGGAPAQPNADLTGGALRLRPAGSAPRRLP